MKNLAEFGANQRRSNPDPPEGLSPAAAQWWRELVAEYAISDPGGRLILETAMRAFMRMTEAQALLDRDGLTVADRWKQQKPHPATTTERDSRIALLGALKALSLDVEPVRPGPGRPPGR